jgi:hypothetical protein
MSKGLPSAGRNGAKVVHREATFDMALLQDEGSPGFWRLPFSFTMTPSESDRLWVDGWHKCL